MSTGPQQSMRQQSIWAWVKFLQKACSIPIWRASPWLRTPSKPLCLWILWCLTYSYNTSRSEDINTAFLMGHQIALPQKTFPTFQTRVGFLVRMDHLVVVKVWLLVEAFAALWTRIGFFPCVQSIVDDEMCIWGKTSLALGTGIRLCPCVCSYMFR